ncbi:MAG TPA: M48 family metallopeptidase [Rariglobus sp.]
MTATRCLLSVLLLFSSAAFAARKPGQPIKPGFNVFSKQQDVELGEANAREVVKQYPVVQDQFLQDYVRRVGARLAGSDYAKSSGFQFRFTALNVNEINAFALPGGPMFIFTGLLKAADNEAQLAGVMGHEMAHVILRHGTGQATKANMLQLPAMLAGAAIGNEGIAGSLGRLGLGLGANSYLLKFSRGAESEADAMGAMLMAEAGYNPMEMARFFQKLGDGRSQSGFDQFFSDHPNPGNRERAIEAEARAFPRSNYDYATGDFPRMKTALGGLPAPPSRRQGGAVTANTPVPAGTWRDYRGRMFSVSYPGNWQVYGDQDASSATLAPREGLVQQNGGTQIGHGAILNYFVPESRRGDLRTATEDLVRHLRADNRRMTVASDAARGVRVAGGNGLVTTLTNVSPFGGGEVDVLLTVQRPQGLFYLVFIVPERDYSRVQSVFQQMVDSLRFSQ